MSDSSEIPLINELLPIQKFEGKGGWTYVALPTISPNSRNPFGWVQVKGMVDTYPLSRYKLMPMGNGHLFLPLSAIVRKNINKQAGDTVQVCLYLDDSALPIPPVFIEALSYDLEAETTFNQLDERHQAVFIKWIFSHKNETVVIDRIASAINDLAKGLNKPTK